MYQKIIQNLEKKRKYEIEHEKTPTKEELEFYRDRIGGYTAVMYVPHEKNYQDMLSKLKPDDILCDMGAGDLRFGLMASEICKKIYAIELSPHILSMALKIIKHRLPRNLIVICADWRYFPIPNDVTVVSCLVNINCADIPIKLWERNNRRVYWGVTSSKEVILLSGEYNL